MKFGKLRVLPHEECLSLLHEYKKTGNIEARNEVITGNLRMVLSLAHRYSNGHSITFEDAYSAGLKGLMDAVDRFDPNTGNKFSVLAYKYIYGYMLNLFKNKWLKGVSLSVPMSGADGDFKTTGQDALPDYSMNPEEHASESDVCHIIHDALDQLSERDRDVMVYYFGISGDKRLTLEDIGFKIGMTKQGVRAIVLRSKKRLEIILRNII